MMVESHIELWILHNKSSGVGSILCPFSRKIVVWFLLGPITHLPIVSCPNNVLGMDYLDLPCDLAIPFLDVLARILYRNRTFLKF